MVKTLLAVASSLRRVWLLEVVGAVLVVVGMVLWLGAPAGWIGGGVAALLKSAEIDLSSSAREAPRR